VLGGRGPGAVARVSRRGLVVFEQVGIRAMRIDVFLFGNSATFFMVEVPNDWFLWGSPLRVC
jgi:hypothetical protein